MLSLLSKRERVRRQAADWLARLQGPASAEDEAQFQLWHQADPAHAEAYERLEGIYKGAGRLAATDLGRQRSLPERGSAFGTRGGFAAALGMLTLLLVAGALLITQAGFWSSGTSQQLLVTSVGEVRNVELEDGSRVIVDSDSQVAVEMTRSYRRLILQGGRARFEVAQNDPRPFTVEAGDARATASDATFDVTVSSLGSEIRSLRGSVEARSVQDRARASITLGPGQAVTIRPGGTQPGVQPVQRSGILWPTGMLDFENVPLSRVIEEANRYSSVQLNLGDETLSSLRVTGTFRAGDAAGLARSLAAAFDLRLKGRGAALVLHPRGSETPARK